jgi:hypothetical protein
MASLPDSNLRPPFQGWHVTTWQRCESFLRTVPTAVSYEQKVLFSGRPDFIYAKIAQDAAQHIFYVLFFYSKKEVPN